jgi:hypothetical protein
MTVGDNNGETQGEKTPSWRNPLVIGLGLVVLILLGAIVGFIASGGLEDDPIAAPTTIGSTVPQTSATSPATVPPSTPATSSTAPTPLGPVPDTSVEGQITYPAAEDTFTNTAEPDEVGGFEDTISLENDPPELKLGLIRFQVTEFPPDETVGTAALKMTIIATPDQPVTVHAVDGDWTELETNAGNAPLVGDVIATIPAGGAPGTEVEVDVTSAVAGEGTVDFYLSTTSDNSIEFASKESGTGPRLTVVFG